jgi:hypothetical protein
MLRRTFDIGIGSNGCACVGPGRCGATTPRQRRYVRAAKGYLIISGGGTMFTDGYIVNGRHNDQAPSGRTKRANLRRENVAVKVGDVAIISPNVVHGWADIPDHVDHLFPAVAQCAAGRLGESNHREVIPLSLCFAPREDRPACVQAERPAMTLRHKIYGAGTSARASSGGMRARSCPEDQALGPIANLGRALTGSPAPAPAARPRCARPTGP